MSLMEQIFCDHPYYVSSIIGLLFFFFLSSFLPFLPSFLLSFRLFLGLHLQRIEVPRLGVQLELQLLAYTTATVMPDPTMSAAHTTAHGNVRSSRILVGFVTTEPHGELLLFFFFLLQNYHLLPPLIEVILSKEEDSKQANKQNHTESMLYVTKETNNAVYLCIYSFGLWHVEVPRLGMHLCQSSNPSHSSDNTGS